MIFKVFDLIFIDFREITKQKHYYHGILIYLCETCYLEINQRTIKIILKNNQIKHHKYLYDFIEDLINSNHIVNDQKHIVYSNEIKIEDIQIDDHNNTHIHQISKLETLQFGKHTRSVQW
jgi:hypothetical protein